MIWEDCIEEAKEELGICGWVDRSDWDKVIDLAKRKYWDGEDFKLTKELTIEEAGGECILCGKSKRLTAHHINYGSNEKTICLDKSCHEIVHKIQRTYGFVVQLALIYWDNFPELAIKLPNMYNICVNVRNKIVDEINKKYEEEQIAPHSNSSEQSSSSQSEDLICVKEDCFAIPKFFSGTFLNANINQKNKQ